MTIEEFVMANGFVDPEKVAAVDLYGFDSAVEMWKDGVPAFSTMENLRKTACSNALQGIKALNPMQFVAL